MRRIVAGAKLALSSKSDVVAALTSEFMPPITPASATGVSPSQISRSSWAQFPLDAVKSRKLYGCSRRSARRSALRRQPIKIEGMQRLAGFEHDIVGHIDDVVDGADAAGFEAEAQPRRRRGDVDLVDDARRIARAEPRIFDR